MISRKLISVLVFLGGLADVCLTIIGQAGRPGILEDDPIGRMFLLNLPLWVFCIFFVLFHLTAALTVYQGPTRLAVLLAWVLLVSDSVAVVFWLAVLGFPVQILSLAVYGFAAFVMVIQSVKKILGDDSRWIKSNLFLANLFNRSWPWESRDMPSPYAGGPMLTQREWNKEMSRILSRRSVGPHEHLKDRGDKCQKR